VALHRAEGGGERAFRRLVELGRRGAALRRDEPDAAVLPLLQLEPVRLRRRAQRLHFCRDRLLRPFAQREEPRLVGLGLERGGERRTQARNALGDAVVKAPAHARRQAVRRGVGRMVEIVEIDPVARRRPLGQGLVEIGERRRHAAGAVLAHHEDVEAEAGHRQAEIERLARAAVAFEVEDLGARGRHDGKARQSHLRGIELAHAAFREN